MDDSSQNDLQSKDSGRNVLAIFSLRLHSSILEGEATEILLPEDCLNEASASPEALRDGQLIHNNDGMDPKHVAVRTEHVGRTHLYTSDIAGALSYSGATSQQRLVVQPSKEIKDLGKKAKARSKEEKLKRPEIVMLDSMPVENPETTKRRPKSLIPKRDKPKPAPRQTKKRKLNASSPKERTGETNRLIDDWMPDVSHIPTYAKEIRSTLVQLHGCPLGCTVEHVKRFFKGLEPERVFVLLRNQAHIPMFDATTDYSYSTMERCENNIRVFVKFAASPTAALATERSGEAIELDHDESSDLKGARVAVTQVSKKIGYVLLELAVDAVAGLPIESTLSPVEKGLHPSIRKILWTVASRDLDLPVDDEIRGASLLASTGKYYDPSTLAGYQTLARHYNRLVGIHDDLLNWLPFPSVEIIDTEFSRQTLIRLASTAAKLLVREMDRIEAVLYQARLSTRLRLVVRG